MSKVYIGIDCAPGAPHPNCYIKGATDLLGIEPTEPDSKFFGAWTWHIDCAKEAYDEAKIKLKEYFNELVDNGHIRGAEWDFEDDAVHEDYSDLDENLLNAPIIADDGYNTTLHVNCVFCNSPHIVKFNKIDYDAWRGGALIQKAMPYLSSSDSELLVSGMCSNCWNEMSGGDE